MKTLHRSDIGAAYSAIYGIKHPVRLGATGRIECPVCNCQEMHPSGMIETEYNEDPAYFVTFDGECGHTSQMVISNHKGDGTMHWHASENTKEQP